MVALRVGVVGVLLAGGAFAEGDAVSDGDLFWSDEDVFDENFSDPGFVQTEAAQRQLHVLTCR